MASNREHRRDQSARESKRRKRRKIDTEQITETSTNRQIKWKSPSEQQTYSTKLIQALRQVRRNNMTPSSPVRGRAVRETADKILAIAARGRTRWSRAILKNRMKLRLRCHKKAARPRLATELMPKGDKKSCSEKEKTVATAAGVIPPVQRRVRVLGRLVPGGRKLSFPSLLEETTDYIAALEMQVRAMSQLAELLSGSQGESSSGRRESSS